MSIYKNITELVGDTPLIRINTLSDESGTEIYGKVEFFNPLSSIKDRIALAMVEDAEKEGKLSAGSLIVEPTSGNTGVGLAFVSAAKGYKLILTMPETMSIERRKILTSLGAEVVLTAGEKGMKGAIEKAEEIIAQNPGSFMPQQFKNPANPEIHRKTTASEIWNDTNGDLDFFVAGVGTGGTITGTGEALKEKNGDLKIIAVEPEESAVLSGEAPGPHKIQGIGAGFVPDVLNLDIIDEIIKIKSDDAAEMSRRIAKTEGLLLGISSGAVLSAAFEIAKKNSGKKIVVILPDSGERYLSTWIYS